jgi:putative membrane protein
MTHILFRVIAILVASYITHVGVPLLPTLNTLWIAFLVTIVLAIINHTIKPLLHIIFIPIHFLTLGLSSFLINGAMIVLASKLVPGFIIPSLLMGFWFSLVLSIINWVLHNFEKE